MSILKNELIIMHPNLLEYVAYNPCHLVHVATCIQHTKNKILIIIMCALGPD